MHVAPERIAVTADRRRHSCSPSSLFDPAGCVALPSPGYPCYRHILTALGSSAVLLETGPATDWMPTPRMSGARAAEGGKGLLIASPANPTGTMISGDAWTRSPHVRSAMACG